MPPYQPVEKLLPRALDSIYKLVLLSSQRSLEIAEGMPPLVTGVNSDKPTVLALEEILAGKVQLKSEQTKEKPKEKAKKQSEK